ncbi:MULTISPECIES: TetR/AcrR family transcriptional regulator [Rhodococcus]|jgi:AcrR family transcriptional regulator|uniref:TetR/AcrR family transcriptional regulator n=1 Tax=Rhodococcus oxybenzonivorans TaxID=1990687 RepID=A0AAE4V0I5_9NOCA|nr:MULTISPECIES: TetR/AcrR family transcriptional regulator [Rhodococcus]MDV7242301.1 TetR/AcrR family transcriptional regulator [Rhodococcus oxybenzonivorans]MDV7266546.1 TetR/AcrR family transcriptional regulator [Rhodococcus oxybenzonivorans]MDV7276203.1 TetR/AcrR family transcriptional regulator [Rhodococcus oxybenzonivorans]MDV7331789.1 TetR/AcrR family transcriptional regulator [Rhodococcus oxybenzonivorans]MDV7344011.1 TetR/AcrR family transcriptional regulator [Rhodococcus oxybenzonivo
MANRLPADKRRAQILEAALTIAAEQGVAALTMRPLAEAAGVSLGVLHYHFDDKDTLLTHLGETQILQVNDGMRVVFGQYTQPGLTGIPALADLLRAGIRGLWPIIEATPNHQLLTYEITAHALRQRSAGNVSAGAIAEQQYRTLDVETVAFLDLCAKRAGVTWITPVEQVARFVLAFMNGLVLRWLVDGDSDAALSALDDLVQILTTKAR